MKRKFGRIPSPFDPRDYNLRSFIPRGEGLDITHRAWEFPAPPLDQLDSNHCAGFTIANFGINFPTFTQYTNDDGHKFYYVIKEIEGEPGKEYGATMRGAAKAMQELGIIENYAFASDLAAIKWWLLNRGPLLVGTIWTRAMTNPIDGIMTVCTAVEGGHAYLINEWTEDEYIGVQNSWGTDWGMNGKAWIKATDFEKVFKMYGEAITAVEIEEVQEEEPVQEIIPLPEPPPVEEVIEPPEPIPEPIPVEEVIEPPQPVQPKGFWQLLIAILKEILKRLITERK